MERGILDVGSVNCGVYSLVGLNKGPADRAVVVDNSQGSLIVELWTGGGVN